MSFIKGTVQCRFCKAELKYFWLFPDAKFEIRPSLEEYIWADHSSATKHYIVSVECSKCKGITTVFFDKNGNLEG